MTPDAFSFVPVWSQGLQAEPCGLSLAREKGWLLAWDKNQWIYLLNQAGEIQAQVRLQGAVAQCAIADDGSGALAAGQGGELRWLAPDLATRWDQSFDHPLGAAAIDPFGHFLAVADTRGNLHFLDKLGKVHAQTQSPRPLQHLTFVPTVALVVGCADYGLVGAFDPDGKWHWREALVVNVGGLSSNGDGSAILLACFSEGLHHFAGTGKAQPRLATPEPCRLVAQSFEGDRILVAGMNNNIFYLDRAGQVLARHALEKPPTALALGPRGEAAYLALAGGGIVKLRIKKSA